MGLVNSTKYGTYDIANATYVLAVAMLESLIRTLDDYKNENTLALYRDGM